MRLNWKAAAGIAVSVVLLAVMFHRVPFAEVAAHMRRADPLWLTVAIVVATLSIPIRALRWRVLLLPSAPAVAFHPRHAATAIGFAANNVLPLRAGEFARALVLRRLTGIPATAALGTLTVERILDGLVIVGLLFATMAAPGFPVVGTLAGIDPRHAAGVLALLMGAVALVLFALVIAPERSVRVGERLAELLLPARARRLALDVLHAFLRGIGVLRSPRLFALSLAWAVAQWTFLALSYYFALLAFGIDRPGFLGALFLQSLVSLAVAAPAAPGFFGTFHVSAVLGLGLWGVPEGQAFSFAVALHMGGFLTVTLLGFYYLWRLNLSWGQLEASQEVVEEAVEHEVEHEDDSPDGRSDAGPSAQRSG